MHRRNYSGLQEYRKTSTSSSLESPKERPIIGWLPLIGPYISLDIPTAFVNITTNDLAFDALRHLIIVSIEAILLTKEN